MAVSCASSLVIVRRVAKEEFFAGPPKKPPYLNIILKFKNVPIYCDRLLLAHFIFQKHSYIFTPAFLTTPRCFKSIECNGLGSLAVKNQPISFILCGSPILICSGFTFVANIAAIQ